MTEENPASPTTPGSPATPAAGTGAPADLRQRAVVGVFWSAAQKWSVRLATLVSFIILSNLLQPSEFGVVALAMTFITVLAVVTDVGFALYLVHVEKLTRRIESTAFYVSTASGLLFAGVLTALAVPLARWFDTPELAPMLPALAASVVLTGVASVPAALLTREMQFRLIAIRQVSSTVISVVVAVVLAFAGAGVWALVAQTLVRSVISTVVLYRISPFRPSWQFSWSQAWTITTFGTKTVLGRLMLQARAAGENVVIGASLGTVALGYWSVANRVVTVVSDLFGSVFASVGTPVFARLQDDPPRLARALGRTLASAAFIMVPTMVALALTAHVMVPAVFGEQWRPAVGVAAVLALYNLVVTLSGFPGSALQATGRPGIDLAAMTAVSVVHIALVLVFAPQGLGPLAVAITVQAVVVAPLRPYLLRRALGVPWRAYAETVVVLLAGGIAAAVVVAVVRPLELEGFALVGAVALIGAVVYLLAVRLLARRLFAEVTGALIGLVRRRSRR